MALDAGSIVYRTKFDDSGLKSGLKGSTATIKSGSNKAGESVGNLNTKLSKTQTLSGGITKAFGAFLGAGVLVGFTKSIIGAGAALEQTEIAIASLTGSTESAKKALGELNQFAAKTPFSSTEVINAGR